MNEATMTDADMKQRENIVKSMKKNFKDFRKRYGKRAKEVMYATATKMAMKEAVKDEADKGEYDYEGDMAKSSLRTIVRNAQMMHDMLGEDTNLPEWVASKITLAEDYIVAAAQYMQSEMSEEVELDEISKELAWKAANKSLEKTRVAAYGSIYGGESGHKRFLKAVRQSKKISDYASAKTPKVPYVKEEVEIEEGSYNPEPARQSSNKRMVKKGKEGRERNAQQYMKNMMLPRSQRKSAPIKGTDKHGNRFTKHVSGPYMGEETIDELKQSTVSSAVLKRAERLVDVERDKSLSPQNKKILTSYHKKKLTRNAKHQLVHDMPNLRKMMYKNNSGDN